jgi:hypothetical protein
MLVDQTIGPDRRHIGRSAGHYSGTGFTDIRKLDACRFGRPEPKAQFATEYFFF